MRIFVTDQWRIATDAYCFRVQKYAGVYASGPKFNQPKWRTEAYCTTLSSAFKSMARRMLLESNTDTAPEALAAATRIGALIDGVLDKLEKRAGEINVEKTTTDG